MACRYRCSRRLVGRGNLLYILESYHRHTTPKWRYLQIQRQQFGLLPLAFRTKYATPLENLNLVFSAKRKLALLIISLMRLPRSPPSCFWVYMGNKIICLSLCLPSCFSLYIPILKACPSNRWTKADSMDWSSEGPCSRWSLVGHQRQVRPREKANRRQRRESWDMSATDMDEWRTIHSSKSHFWAQFQRATGEGGMKAGAGM